jgi:type VI secretion system secreted protein VgrG
VTVNSAETIGAAKELTIGGLYQVSVGGIMNETVGGAKAEEVGLAKALVVGANMTTKVMGKLTYDVGDQIEIQSGSSSLVMKSDGKIEISGKNVVMKTVAGRIEIDEGGIITIKGTMVKINN